MLTDRKVYSWDQLTLGGGVQRFHSETIAGQPREWECNDENCSECYNHEQENK